eukprot:TRINITY_DN36612_c0_g3_i1.p1 TRINITY_DN36612_c0_g3~~TRINITY_DN36612_c0_g3_i1.p1  ORF type:complete len:238 (+),score=75.80 TRINITY_DN36612_c0_g3_i1:98-811(+)
MTTLTLEYIKCATGEFDPETVFQAILSGRSISRIDAVGQCCNLRWLDLSRNQIYRIEGLEGLVQLSVLDLSFNKIPKVEGLDGLGKLERLDLRSNPISRIQDLDGLSAARKSLKHLRLQNIDGKDFCPVCLQTEYKKTVHELCGELVALDSKRKHLPDLEAEVARLEKFPEIELPTPEPWFTKDDLDPGDLQDPEAIASAVQPQVEEFEKALAECKAAMKEAEEVLAAARDTDVGSI